MRTRFLSSIGLLAALTLALIPMAGCGAKEKIERRAALIGQESRTAASALQAALEVEGLPPKARVLIESAIARQDTITAAAADIHDELPGIKNVVPLWRRLLAWGVTGIVLVFIVAVLIWTGLWPVAVALTERGVRCLMSWVVKVFHPQALHGLAERLREGGPE